MAGSDRWYILQGGQWVGPKSSGELHALAASGRLTAVDVVVQEGMSAGISAANAGFVAAAVVSGPVGAAAFASRGQRLGAALIDGLLSVASLIPGMVLSVISLQTGPDTRSLLTVLGSLTILLALFGLQAYQWYLLTRSGQTLGKRLVKVRVVKQEDEGLPGFGRVVGIRLLLNALFAMWPPYAIMDVLFIFGERRECLHDRLAGTKVVQS